MRLQQVGHHAGAQAAALAVSGTALELEAHKIFVIICASQTFHRAEVVAVAGLQNHVIV